MAMCRCAPVVSRSHRLGQQAAEPDQVVGRCLERKDRIDERTATMMELAQVADGFHPAERLLNEFAFPLADRAPGMPCRALIDRAGASVGVGILHHVGRHLHLASLVNKRPTCRSSCRCQS